MKRFFGKRRVTRTSPGGPTAQPLGRLGALVFQLNNSDKLYWASLWAPTRIAGCALSHWPDCHPLEKRFSERSALRSLKNQSLAATPTVAGSVFRLVPCLRSRAQKLPSAAWSR